ncbi:MAG: hypothetical protein IT455_07265 [Planctomycetes bacterium]|nr:hypothetical protein [Planctomycetota bacterium]
MKRLLAFLLLLSIGTLVLMFAVGEDPAARANSQTGAAEEQPQPAIPRVDLGAGRVSASVAQTGPLRNINEMREVQLGNGRVRLERVYVLNTADSRPIGQGLQQLDGVSVELYEHDQHTATIEAKQAFVELQRDANGVPTFKGSKTFDLRDAVFHTLSASRVAGLRFELGNVKATVEDDAVILRSPDDQPVLVTLDGDRRGTLRGIGLQARLPRNQQNGLHRIDVELLRQPDLVAEGLHVRAAGRLHYVEDTTSGAAMITIDDDVQLDMQGGQLAVPGLSRARRDGTGADETASARGDQFTAWLVRLRTPRPDGDEHQEMVWQRARLIGAPARIEVPGGIVTTPRLVVLPGLSGEPLQVTALGGESRLEAHDLGPAAKPAAPIVATARRRTHLVRPGEYVGSVHRAYGFPSWSLRGLDQLQLVICEGQATLDNGQRRIEAADGVRVLRRDGTEAGIVEGLGVVRCVVRPRRAGQPELIATGDDGFLLIATPTSERLRIGPPAAAAERVARHHFVVDYGDARLDGHGSCELTGAADRRRLQVRSPGADVRVRVPGQGLELARVLGLDAEFDVDSEELLELTVDGLPLQVTWRHRDELLTATAPRLTRIGARSLRLLPVPAHDAEAFASLAEVDRRPLLRRETAAGERAELRGPRLDVHQLGGRDVLLDAEAVGDDRPHVTAVLPPQGGGAPTTIDCLAQRLRLLPFVVTRQAMQAHLGGRPGLTDDIVGSALSRPWLLVDEVLDFRLDDPHHGHSEGRAHRLLVSQGGQAALFVGDPDGAPAFVRQRQQGREVITEGARVRVFRDEVVRLQTLSTYDNRSLTVLPTVTLHEAAADGLLSHMRATCRGDIEVWPEAVTFGGPVLARGIHPDGEDDPDGITIDAERLHLVRHPETGRILSADARNVHVDWSRLTARGTRLELDERSKSCVIHGEPDAEVELPNGAFFKAPRLEVWYQTMAIRSFRGHGGQRVVAPASNPTPSPAGPQ